MKMNRIFAVVLSLCAMNETALQPAQEFPADLCLSANAEEEFPVVQASIRIGDETMKMKVEYSNAVPGGWADVYISPYSHDQLQKLDFTVSWEDTPLTTSGIFQSQGLQVENKPTYSHVVADPTTLNPPYTIINDTMEFWLQFDIPLDAVPGTSYDITLSAVDRFRLYNGEDLASSIKTPVSVSIIVQDPPISGYCGNNMNGDEREYEQAQWYYDRDTKTLTISGKGKTSFFKSPEIAPWYSFSAEIQKVVIEEGITGIGGNSFEGYAKLTDVSIPKSLFDVDFNPFDATPWFENLKTKSDPVIVNDILIYASDEFCKGNVVIPDGVRSIASDAISNRDAITGVKIPDSVEYISRYAFSYCEQLREVSLGNHVTILDEGAFSNCPALEEIVLPDTLNCIKSFTFENCKNLKSVTFGKNLKSIGFRSFENCSSLEDVQIPDSVEEIRSYAFTGTPFLEQQKGVKYAGAFVIDCDADVTSAVLRKGTKKIAENAFEKAQKIEVVILPDGLTDIMPYSFRGCRNLKEITIPSSVKKIGEDAFNYCEKLERIIVMNPYCRIDQNDHTISNGVTPQTYEPYFNGTIYGYQDSTAQDYAERYGYAFQSLGKAPAYLAGDINADGVTTVADAVLLQKWLLAVPDTFMPNRKAADLNGDGILDVYDLALMKRALIQ